MNEKRVILVIEDEHTISNFICRALSANDYKPIPAFAGKEGLSLYFSHGPDLVLLDLMLPEEDGLHILKRIRAGASTARLPVILITAKGTEYDKVVGLDGGADDYIAKPFGMMELMARIRTALRHSGGEAEPVHALTLGPLRIDPARHQVLAHGREVTLTLKEFQLLSLLVEHAGTVFTRDQLLNTIWGYEFDGASRTVDVHVRTLRQKLGEAGRCIETVRGVGYKAESDPSKSEEQP